MSDDILKDAGVYGIIHSATEKLYVGSTARSFDIRFKDHRRELRKGKHHSKKLQRAWDKYGEDAFEFVIFRRCGKGEVLKYEQMFIERLLPEYNHNPVACSPLGVKRDKSSIEKMKAFQRSVATKYLVHGEMLCPPEMAEKYDISINTIYARIQKGYSGDSLVTKRNRGGEPNTGKRYLINGEYLTVRELSKKYGIAAPTINRRIKVGWDLSRLVDPILDSEQIALVARTAMHKQHDLLFEIRGERLTINEMEAKYGVNRNTIYYRHSRGKTGDALIAPPSRSKTPT